MAGGVSPYSVTLLSVMLLPPRAVYSLVTYCLSFSSGYFVIFLSLSPTLLYSSYFTVLYCVPQVSLCDIFTAYFTSGDTGFIMYSAFNMIPANYFTVLADVACWQRDFAACFTASLYEAVKLLYHISFGRLFECYFGNNCLPHAEPLDLNQFC